MMATKEIDLEKLERDFLSGRNPRAFIPLCNQLRRERQYQRALELCQRGLERGEDSLASRMLMIRLLGELARYDQALAQIRVAERQFGETVSMLVERAHCQLRLMLIEEAAVTYRRLDQLNPFDPRVGVIGREVRVHRTRTVSHSSEEVFVRWASLHGLEQVIAAIRSQISGLGKVNTIAIVDLDSNKTCVEGDVALAEVAETFYGDAAVALDELGQGQAVYGVLELSKLILLILRRDRRLVTVAVDPQVNFGRFLHRVLMVMQQYLPSHDTATEDETGEPELL